MTDVAVETAYGKVSGSAEAGVYSFKGIPYGGPLGLGAVTHAFLKVTHRTGLEGLRRHDLCHSYASLTLAAGMGKTADSNKLGRLVK